MLKILTFIIQFALHLAWRVIKLLNVQRFILFFLESAAFLAAITHLAHLVRLSS
ncbi:MAG: hypothetical protein ACI9C4_002552 [Paraglaciecola sp.]|jgi:hypothetical protein